MTKIGDEILAGLDAAQREAATTLRGPVCILAGAGTGKTRTLTSRIAFGISAGVYSPDRVLALTFTTKAAGELSTRLRALGSFGVEASTFHAAALRQLRHFWPTVVGGEAPRILDGKAKLLTESAKNLGLRYDSNALRDLASDIEWRKTSNLTVDAYADLAAPRGMVASWSVEQVLALHAEYERLKDERRLIDFEDVLLLTAGLLSAEDAALAQVREKYRTFVVDEYQDVSPLQHELLSLWLGERRDLCVVGDASQTIYSFTGATSRFLLEFRHVYSDASVIELETNYRSSEPIIRVANAVVRNRPGALTLRASRAGGLKPVVTRFSDDVAEAREVASKISRQIAAGVSPRDIAVLFRVNAQSAAVEQALADAGVSYQIAGATRFFEIPEVKQAIMALRGASVSHTTDPLFKSVSDVMRSLGWTQDPPGTTGAIRAKWEALNAIVLLADNAPPGTTLRSFSTELMQRQEARHEPSIDSVTLSTVHAAKGLEWHSVYLIGVSDGLIPLSLSTSAEALEEERRVLYVALTRARERLTLSWAGSSGGHGGVRERSRFLADLDIDTPRGT